MAKVDGGGNTFKQGHNLKRDDHSLNSSNNVIDESQDMGNMLPFGYGVENSNSVSEPKKYDSISNSVGSSVDPCQTDKSAVVDNFSEDNTIKKESKEESSYPTVSNSETNDLDLKTGGSQTSSQLNEQKEQCKICKNEEENIARTESPPQDDSSNRNQEDEPKENDVSTNRPQEPCAIPNVFDAARMADGDPEPITITDNGNDSGTASLDVTQEMATGEQEDEMDLTMTEENINAIVKTWEPVWKDKKRMAIEVFVKLFTMYPEAQNFFRDFRGLTIDEVRVHKKLRAHGLSVMYAVKSYIDSIDDEDTFDTLIRKNAINHIERKVGEREFKWLAFVFVEVLNDNLKDKVTDLHRKSWTKLFFALAKISGEEWAKVQ